MPDLTAYAIAPAPDRVKVYATVGGCVESEVREIAETGPLNSPRNRR